MVEELSEEQRETVKIVAEKLSEKTYEEQDELDGDLFDCRDESELDTGEFFSTMYQVILSRDQGPRLSRLILGLGQEETLDILQQVE